MASEAQWLSGSRWPSGLDRWLGLTTGGPHRRTGQHPFGGGGRPTFARMDSVGGGGGSSRHFPGSIFCGGGGGVVAENFRDPDSVGCQNFFPLTAVTDPEFMLFKHVLCFARIMSTLCRIGGGGQLPPLPPVLYAYGGPAWPVRIPPRQLRFGTLAIPFTPLCQCL